MLMIGKQLTAEQRLTKCMAEILGNDAYAPLAGILMLGEHTIEDDLPTACTDGKNAKYGRKFVEELSDAEFRFLILHESYHVLYRHLTTYLHLYEDNPKKANMACDYVINLKLCDDTSGFIKMPSCGLIDGQYRGMDSVQVYNLLSDDGDGEGGAGASEEGMDQHDWEKSKTMTAEDSHELERAVEESIRQGILLAGKLGSGGIRELESLVASKVDWREALREFVSTTCSGNDYSTWRRPNRKFIGMDMYLPSGISEAIGEVVIAIDTSGSIGQRELNQFLSEVSAICKAVQPSGVRLLYWDTAICRAEYYTQDQLDDITKSTKPAGGGGTTVQCVPDYLKDNQIKPQCVIVITDGYVGSWGSWSDTPLLWCVVNNKTAVADVGTTIHMEN